MERRWGCIYFFQKVNEGIIDTSEYVRLVVVVVSCYARGSVQIYVLCDKKMNTKEQHTSAFSQGRYYNNAL